MDCAEEVATLRRELERLPGVTAVEADLVDRVLFVTTSADGPSDAQLVEAVAKTGMTAEPLETQGGESIAQPHRAERHWKTTAVGGAALVAGLVVHLLHEADISAVLAEPGAGASDSMPLGAGLLYGAAVVASGWSVAPRALASARLLRPDMNLLMAIAVLGAVAIGEWFEAASVSFLFSLSLALESWSVGRARRAVAALLAVAPPEARLLDDAAPPGQPSFKIVRARDVRVGSRLMVVPGDRVPLDGKIERGRSAFDEAPITGESRPVEKGPGDEVFAGTVNGDEAVVVVTTRPHDDTIVARIVRLVGAARAQRGPAQRFVDRFAAIYTPAVLVVAIVMATIMPLVADGGWRDWLYQSLVFLVIACPCALVISTPVSIVCALARAARSGVLIKGAEFVESLAQVRAFALDKTGTITAGRPAVLAVLPASGTSETRVLEIAAAVESTSSHPLAKAIVSFAAARGIVAPPVEASGVVKGRGVTAKIEGREAWVGSHRFLDENGGETPGMHDSIKQLESRGATIAAVGFDGSVLGALGLADAVRPEAAAALSALCIGGVAHLAMLTGDHIDSARAIAASVGIDDVRAQLLPEDKVEAIAEMLAQWKHVAMVGDGVNDAPSLARATVGIAMGGSGSGAAIETADVTLMHDDLLLLPWIVKFAKSVRATIRFNIVISLLVKAVFVILALLGYASLWSAIAADMGVSLAVVANALRLLAYPPPVRAVQRLSRAKF